MTGLSLTSPDLEATRRIGLALGAALRAGHVLALVGPLGSGKTTLVRSLAEGAGVADLRQVNSPTFVLVNEYSAGAAGATLRIFHIDVYRLRGSTDLESLGFDEMCANGAVIVEWADRVVDALPEDRLTITIEPTGPDSRVLHCQAGGAEAEQLLDVLSGR